MSTRKSTLILVAMIIMSLMAMVIDACSAEWPTRIIRWPTRLVHPAAPVEVDQENEFLPQNLFRSDNAPATCVNGSCSAGAVHRSAAPASNIRRRWRLFR